ncbi:hypothetical protein ACIQWR_19740 [Streptomyces sp. NPDC098789]|uniref:hypothetical protein n=1 Tax=Streptomyces sp. NPDC098789 TaxID=3366098 RepID=UPI0038248643
MAASPRQARGEEDAVLDDGPDRPKEQARSHDVLAELASLEEWAHRAGGRVADREREFAVRTRTVAGMHALVSVTARANAGDPAPAAVGAADALVLGSVVRGLLDLAGYQAGAARTVVVLTGRSARVVACTGPFEGFEGGDADAPVLPGTSGRRGTGGEPFGKARGDDR